MQILTDFFDDIHPGYPINNIAPIDKILFIDIETTGLSREHTDLYLIGCGYFSGDGYNTIQWFADTVEDEPKIIRAFDEFVRGRFTMLMHYNGNHFDIPYLKAKALKHGLDLPFSCLDNYDIYAAIKPYKKVLSLPSLRQRCIEQLLEINSDDPYTGQELISVYRRYANDPSDELLAPLIYHNSEDLKGMAYILPILYYTDLSGLKLTYVSHGIHAYKDFADEEHRELLVTYSHDLNIPKGFNSKDRDVILHVSPGHKATLRIPILDGVLKQYYNNFRDYYYLPEEDTCIYKSAASGVPASRRTAAKKETCYTKHSGLFIPILFKNVSPILKKDYSSKENFMPFDENNCEDLLKEIGLTIIDHML
ncbi:MAG: ribonuclease H-like domain-containing protein [Lachnospiraceae bacterium]|nr:ribonuclease H-like domain-containing protein [Lachnospiraceae bacterium]